MRPHSELQTITFHYFIRKFRASRKPSVMHSFSLYLLSGFAGAKWLALGYSTSFSKWQALGMTFGEEAEEGERKKNL